MNSDESLKLLQLLLTQCIFNIVIFLMDEIVVVNVSVPFNAYSTIPRVDNSRGNDINRSFQVFTYNNGI